MQRQELLEFHREEVGEMKIVCVKMCAKQNYCTPESTRRLTSIVWALSRIKHRNVGCLLGAESLSDR